MGLHRHPEFNPVVRRMNEILLGAEVTLGSLNRGVAKEQLDLFQFTTRGPAQLRARPPEVVGSNARNACRSRVALK